MTGDGGGLGGALPGDGERGLGAVAARGPDVREMTQPFSGDDGARAKLGDGPAALGRLAGWGRPLLEVLRGAVGAGKEGI